jgi:hypothetical protein
MLSIDNGIRVLSAVLNTKRISGSTQAVTLLALRDLQNVSVGEGAIAPQDNSAITKLQRTLPRNGSFPQLISFLNRQVALYKKQQRIQLALGASTAVLLLKAGRSVYTTSWWQKRVGQAVQQTFVTGIEVDTVAGAIKGSLAAAKSSVNPTQGAIAGASGYSVAGAMSEWLFQGDQGASGT